MSVSSYEFVEAVVENGVGRLTLNSPKTLNAMTVSMMKEFADVLERWELDKSVRVVQIEGKGRAFSAGADKDFLHEIQKISASDIKNIIYRHFAGGTKRLRDYPKPTIAVMRGAATGAGLELALACDFRLTTHDAFIAETWIKLGLIDPLGGMSLLPRLVGLAKANEILLMGEGISGEEAERIGLVNRAVPDEELEDLANKWAQKLASGAPLALQAMKEGIRRGLHQSIDDMAAHNIVVQSQLIGTEDFKEGVRSVFEKDKPNFEGK
ncbi:crotonase [Sneathiella sp. P13V-1]|uniref:enoyl-CoA hydratase/isomerase family protein n=1 Tax=Sneathiella sp. P13V-1 TaxID=2697366 RepID=UPI00187B38EB|nr:enoyl-CoA hydratase-related protein [Sneathiella sp. P13V-1]MBE7638611.1 crotonase [Sneathiella sp. P13V-1]